MLKSLSGAGDGTEKINVIDCISNMTIINKNYKHENKTTHKHLLCR
jgi:hypothetical protein